MDQEKLRILLTNITTVLHNYLILAKQSGRITIILDAVEGNVTQCIVSNSLKINLDGLEDAKKVSSVPSVNRS
jgi:hypothetical protein